MKKSTRSRDPFPAAVLVRELQGRWELQGRCRYTAATTVWNRLSETPLEALGKGPAWAGRDCL